MDILEYKRTTKTPWAEMATRVNETPGPKIKMRTVMAHAYRQREPNLATIQRYIAAYPGVTLDGLAGK